MTGGLNPAAVSLVKLRTGIHDPERAAIAMEIAGRTGIAWPADDTAASAPAVTFLNGRVMSLAGGSNEIQRNIEIGRASCRERVCQYVSISVVAVSLKKKTI